MMTDLIGYTAGLLLALCFLPQVIKTWRLKHANDVSMGMLILTLASMMLYQVYAGLLSLWPVIVMNGVFGVLVLVEIGLKFRYDRVRGASRIEGASRVHGAPLVGGDWLPGMDGGYVRPPVTGELSQ